MRLKNYFCIQIEIYKVFFSEFLPQYLSNKIKLLLINVKGLFMRYQYQFINHPWPMVIGYSGHQHLLIMKSMPKNVSSVKKTKY